MDHLKKRLRSRRGFTLAELLIVVAIIAVLIAIAIPVFSSQLESSREAVDEANQRSAESLAASTYLMNKGVGSVDFYFGFDGKNLGINSTNAVAATNPGLKDVGNGTAYPFTGGVTGAAGYNKAKKNGASNAANTQIIIVTVNDGKVSSKWGTKS